MEKSLVSEFNSKMFHVRRSIKYHDYRWAFYDKILNVSLFLALATGPMAVVIFKLEAAVDQDWIRFAPAIFTSIFTGASLILRVNVKANRHHQLREAFIRLRQSMERGKNNMTKEDLAQWTSDKLEIETREFPINRVVDAICHNEVSQSMGFKQPSSYVKVSGWHRIVGPFTRFFDKSLRLYHKHEKGPYWDPVDQPSAPG